MGSVNSKSSLIVYMEQIIGADRENGGGAREDRDRGRVIIKNLRERERERERERKGVQVCINIKMAYPVKYVHDLVPPLESQN